MRKFLPPLIVGSILVIGAVALNARIPSGPTPSTTLNIEQEVNHCMTRLGYVGDTVMTHERFALFSLCMHPTMKQLGLLK